MNHLIIILYVVLTLCGTLFAGNSGNNLSTTLALKKYGYLLKNQSFLVYPELREKPIRWFDSIPEGKVNYAVHPEDFELQAKPGELFVFQLGLWALDKDVKDVQVIFPELKATNGKLVPSTRFTCFNSGGIDFRGKPFAREVNVTARHVQALWIGADLDKIKQGNYTGSVTVLSNGEQHRIPVLLSVAGDEIPNHGYNEGARLSRLGWLNSTVGINGEITKGYLPVNVEKITSPF